VVGTDLFVTLANIGGGEVPQDRVIDGIDIAPVWSGGGLPSRSVFWALDSRSELEFAVREGPWKLMLNHEMEAKELYNLADDPLELFNLLTKEGEMAQHLREQFQETLASIESDPLRPPDPVP
jgi:hypothetical protein